MSLEFDGRLVGGFRPVMRPRADAGVYFMLYAYVDVYILSLVEQMLENLSVSVKIRILKALKFQVESYDLTALGFSVMNLHHWVFQL